MSLLHWASVTDPYVTQNSSDKLLEEAAPARRKIIAGPALDAHHA